jgi:hypothetical protein
MTTATLSTTETGFTRAAFEAFLESRREPQWLIDRRRAAWEAFAAMPLPDMKQEEWRRTDVRLLRLDRFGLPAPPPAEDPLPAVLLAENVDLNDLAEFREEGDSPHLCEAPFGPFRQMGTVPFFPPKIVQGHLGGPARCSPHTISPA